MGAKTTKEIAGFICGSEYRDLPSEVAEYAKVLALSHLGQNIAGSTLELGRRVTNYVKGRSGQPEAGIFGAGFRANADYAALANGNSAHAVELEDKSHGESVYSVGHWPTVFAMGEKLGVSGKDMIAASVIGYEVASQLNWALVQGPSGKARSPSACCTIGNAASAAKLLRLDVGRTASALSLAASQVAGIGRQTGSAAHVVEAGFFGRNGVCAAELAAMDCTGQPDILEGKAGFGDLWSDCPEFDLPLGEDYTLMRVDIRKYSCAGAAKQNVDGLFELIAAHNIEWEDVATVEHGISSARSGTFRYDEPATADETHFSLPHITVACFLDDKQVFLPSFTEEKVRDPRWREARRKVRVTVQREGPDDAYRFESPVTITMKNGKVYRKLCSSARGKLDDHKFGRDDAIRKYMQCVDFARIFSRARADRIAEMTLALDQLDDVSKLAALLTFPDLS